LLPLKMDADLYASWRKATAGKPLHLAMHYSARRYAQRLRSLSEKEFQEESRDFMTNSAQFFRRARENKIDLPALLWESGIASAAGEWIAKPIVGEPGSPQWIASARARAQAWDWVWRANVSESFAEELVLPILKNPIENRNDAIQFDAVAAALRTLRTARGEWANRALIEALGNIELKPYHEFIARIIEQRQSTERATKGE
jgi:hypothetical protein